MKQWVGNAHGDQVDRCLREKREGRFDFRGGRDLPGNKNKCFAFWATFQASLGGFYVSTGGLTKDAKYEADRGSIPVVLLDLDDLSNEIVRYYGEMDMEARSLIPLTTILWPT